MCLPSLGAGGCFKGDGLNATRSGPIPARLFPFAAAPVFGKLSKG